MNKYLITVLLVLFATFCDAQNFQGQWKGGFIDRSTSLTSWGGDRCDYVVDIDVDGNKVTGYSYTYFSDGGKKYYTICKLEGTLNRKKKYIEVTEVARTKTNVPINISNSYQVHKLKYRKEDGNEILEGTWNPAPEQDPRNAGNGYGTTLLSKRQLTDISPLAKNSKLKNNPFSPPEKPTIPTSVPKTTIVTVPQKNSAVSTKPIIKKPTVVAPSKPSVKNAIVDTKKDTSTKQPIVTITPRLEKIVPPGFENRNNTILQTVIVENATVKLELYDNGDVDGDSVSLFYNGRVLLAHKRLSETPILLEIPVPVNEVNELVMYADNLGTLPPNTALMIVRDGNKRYEVRITSDLKKSGTIRFVHKKNE
ncbi:MAG: hypothetical protein LH615_14640 [Ferruginibacter sp.]|nr:hypothetical protein [Ferruginibacter sp.]